MLPSAVQLSGGSFSEQRHCTLIGRGRGNDSTASPHTVQACGGDFDRAMNMFYGALGAAICGVGRSKQAWPLRCMPAHSLAAAAVCVARWLITYSISPALHLPTLPSSPPAEQTGGARRPHPPDVPPRPHAPHELGAAPAGARAAQAYPGAARGALPPPLAFLGALLGAPFALLAAGVRLAGRAASVGAAVVGAVARAVLPRRIFAALAGALRALTAAGAEVAPARAAEEFARAFTGGRVGVVCHCRSVLAGGAKLPCRLLTAMKPLACQRAVLTLVSSNTAHRAVRRAAPGVAGVRVGRGRQPRAPGGQVPFCVPAQPAAPGALSAEVILWADRAWHCGRVATSPAQRRHLIER